MQKRSVSIESERCRIFDNFVPCGTVKISILSSGCTLASESMTALTDAAEPIALMITGRDCGIVPFEQHATQIETIRSVEDSDAPFLPARVDTGIPT